MAAETLSFDRRMTKPLVIHRVTASLSLIGLIVFLIVMLFPLAMVTINSFKTESEYYANGPFSLPQNYHP